MYREVHVRFWERPEVKALRATRHGKFRSRAVGSALLGRKMEGILVRDFAAGDPAREKSGAVFRRARVLEGDMFLTESYVAGAASPVVREMTLGDLLGKAAEDHPGLIAGVPDPALRRQWTYAQFYREAQRTARALLTRLRRLARR